MCSSFCDGEVECLDGSDEFSGCSARKKYTIDIVESVSIAEVHTKGTVLIDHKSH